MKKILQNKSLYIILIIIIWRVSVLVIPPTIASQTNKTLVPSLENWNRWDAPHYLYIAKNGYTSHGDPANFIVFQPLYPLVVRTLNIIFNNFTLAAIITSNTFFVAATLIFYTLVKEVYDKKTAQKACIFLNIFPTTYFFSIGYTESLFLLILVLSFYLVKKNKWLNASIVGSLAFLTRTIGIVLLPTLILTSILNKREKITQKVLKILLISIPFLATISLYLAINWIVFKNIFAFKTILENNWHKQFAFPWVSIKNTMQLITNHGTNSMTLGYFEGIPAILGVILIPVAIKKLKFQDWLYYLLGIIFITSTNFLLSTPRYLLSIPPFFILLGIISKKNIIFYPLVLVSLILLVYFSTLFVQGQWAF